MSNPARRSRRRIISRRTRTPLTELLLGPPPLTRFLEYHYTERAARRGASWEIAVDDCRGDAHQLYPHMRITVDRRRGARLRIRHVPLNDEIRALITQHGGSIRRANQDATAIIPVHAQNTPLLRLLAQAIMRVITSGRYYEDRNLRWQCPRLAANLVRLANALQQYYAEHEGSPTAPSDRSE